LAKSLSPTTIDILLGQTGGLDARDALLACVAAIASDGSPRALETILIHALQRGVPAAELREVLLEIAPLAGSVRAERALAALGAVFPLDARAPLEDFIHAARGAGVSGASLWAIADLLARMFQEGPETRSAVQSFEVVLGRRARDEGPGS